MNRTCLVAGTLLLAIPIAFRASLGAADDRTYKRAALFQSRVQPLLETYCTECHSGDVTEADLDLEAFKTFSDVRRQANTWMKIREMLDNEQMPPRESPQPLDEERSQLQDWIHKFLANEARVCAGDPGPIVLRRLSNSEYTYAIRDLTHVDSLEPTREFPIDSAAGEGFTNVGSGQGMSPSLIQKYLDAAKQTAAHIVLLPKGIRFSKYTTQRDRTDELLTRIQAFYRQFTADGGGTAVDLQGITFETNQGGVLPVANYLAATLGEREALLAGRRTIGQVAEARNLNARYLHTLWNALTREAQGSSFLLDAFRNRWQRAKPADVASMTAEIERAQQALWKFNSIGQSGREGGPTRWLEAVSPVTTSHEMRLPLPAALDGADVVITLTAQDLGDGHDQDFVVWRRPRLEFPGGESESFPPILLRDLPYGVDPSRFGTHPNGATIAPTDLCLQAPHTIDIRLPADLAKGAEFVATGILHEETGRQGSVQLQIQPKTSAGVSTTSEQPVLIHKDGEVRDRIESALKEFRELFPPALCYARIVPVDEVVTLTLFHREDDHLRRLMLDDQQAHELDQLWDELYFVSEEPFKLAVAFEQISEFATQDRPDLVKAFAPLREPINRRAAAFREKQIAAEPSHLQALLELSERAWRRPLSEAEQQSLRALYGRLRNDEIPHAEAIRLTLARVLTSPAFLYKLEEPSSDAAASAVNDFELATRLSFFLWSSIPDQELRSIAAEGRLQDESTLLEQMCRMLHDRRTRRLAVQFACQWLHVRDFHRNDDKNESLYPEFAALRGAMYEETVMFFEDMFRNDGSILDILVADHTFLNEALASHYGLDSVKGEAWRKVAGVRLKGRGGVLGMGTVLASQSGASRTSPILRGNWVYETLLGERLPRPPANVPQLPETLPSSLTARQLIEQHSSAEACAKCHVRIDPFGFALEQYDAIGRLRPVQADTRTRLPDGQVIEGFHGLQEYLQTDRRDDIVRQFCRKLLGFALGREIQLSDEPLLNRMHAELQAQDYRFNVAVKLIVTSPQFRNIRGRGRNED